jgi:hypothetical protein
MELEDLIIFSINFTAIIIDSIKKQQNKIEKLKKNIEN